MLKQHAGHEDEILGILGNEFGHWYQQHKFKSIPIDALYVVVFARCITVVMNDSSFLTDFGFSQNSYVMTLFIFIQFWKSSINCIFKLFNEYQSRRDELEADSYTAKIGLGLSLRSALIRNFKATRENIFVGSL